MAQSERKRTWDWNVAFATIFILFMTGGISRLLAGGISEGQAIASTEGLVGIQITAVGLYGLALLLLAARPGLAAIDLCRNWILFLPIIWAIASISWAYAPDLTVRRCIALVGTTLGGIYIARTLGERRFMHVLAVCLAGLVIAGIVTVLVLPQIGKHVSNDTMHWSAIHAGRWRGTFWHKNAFGPVAALCFICWLLAGKALPFSYRTRFFILATSLIAVFMSGCAQAIVQVIAAIAFWVYLNAFRGHGMRSISAALILLLFTVLIFSWPDISDSIFQTLGRSGDFSGRTTIWDTILSRNSNNPWVGGGYGTGFLGGLDQIMETLLYQRFTNAHNGFLQQYIDLGYVGIALVIIAWARFAFMAAKHRKGPSPYSQIFIFFIFFYFSTNLVDNYFMRSQDIYWFLFSAFLVLMDAPPSARVASNKRSQTLGPSAPIERVA